MEQNKKTFAAAAIGLAGAGAAAVWAKRHWESETLKEDKNHKTVKTKGMREGCSLENRAIGIRSWESRRKTAGEFIIPRGISRPLPARKSRRALRRRTPISWAAGWRP